jgi:predicted extracellular nuclease
MKWYLLSICTLVLSCNEQDSKTATVAFYNLENLFDTLPNIDSSDIEYTPNGEKKWDTDKYTAKLQHLAKVISELANGEPPTFLGVCEIENKKVLEDLIAEPSLKNVDYAIVHLESPDERGIDVGFIYNKSLFTVEHFTAHQPDLSYSNDKTRDILHVQGKVINGETLHFIINHWPSRGGYSEKSDEKRNAAATKLNAIKYSILKTEPNAKIIVMGDFNDEPSNTSIAETLAASCNQSATAKDQFFNAFCAMDNAEKGSYRYKNTWEMLDQIMVSSALLTDTTGIHFKKNSATIKSEPWMLQTGKFEGYPLRTFAGNTYLNGYSDHLPVYIVLQN